MSFVHLHVHSEYSLLDGFSNIKKLIKRAKEMDMPAIGLTDHGTMFGVIDFYNAATHAGIKPIIGVESYLAARGMKERDGQLDKRSTHLLLLAENETGYRNLLQIASAAQLDGFYYYPRIDHEFLARHSEGLICTSGCMSAEVPRLIQNGDMEGARRQLDWYYQVFGRDNFFLELQQHDIKELDNINKMLLDLGRRYDARFVATNDVHYVDRDDARLQDILLAVQTGCLLSDPNRMRMTDNSYYLRSPEEMAALFAEVPDALSNTLLIAERCSLDLGFKGYHLPEFDVPPGFTAETYLRSLCEEGMQRRYGSRAVDPVVRERLEYELGIIHKMGFDTYFLIVWDLCRHARHQGIWYNARGSAAGSMVAYTLDITLVDPIEHGLIFERFLNPGRISMPDIDLDFRDDRRAEMMEYTANKYGDDKVAQIITFGTLGARAAIRDVGRVMDIPLTEVDRVAKLIPNVPGKPVTIRQALEEVTEFKDLYKSTPYLRELIDTAKHMEGVVRNAGTHAAGVIITDKPIIEYIPLHRPTGSSAAESPVKTVTQFEMSILDSLGLLKVDFLGLATLTIMARACDLIQARHGISLNLDNIPTDDPATYELLGRGETAGVFQVEGSGMRRYLMQMKPKELANVIAMVALFRPGPMDFIPGYIRRMHGEEPVEYRHPLLEPIFKETYGYPVYQEQLMFAVMQLGGYTAPEADDLRKAISKKLKDKLQKHRSKFVAGAVVKGVPEDTACAIFDDWEEFARYGFNKCLPGSVEVVDAASGRLVRIEDLFHGRDSLQETLSCDLRSLRLEPGQVSAVMANGVKPVYRLTTGLGRSIEATGNHPFYTPHGWRRLDALHPGDKLAVPRSLPVEGRREWAEQTVIDLGHCLAALDCSLTQLPPDIFELPNRQVRLLLACIFDAGDSFATASERLARQLQHLLLRVGHLSTLEQVAPSLYRLSVSQPVLAGGGQAPLPYAPDDIYWDTITGIDFIGRKPTYDLEVQGSHNFIANDILVHNSHAVDYGVISVQTAYLKTHYTVEYMTALMSVTKNDTAKVALYVADCRRMGIAVEPPDVNASEWDFAIEDQAEAKPVIRFGLGAVKNVGQGPVDAILKGRQEGGPFADLNDFARRVDLRQVGKRALESLVRVGALDRFGPRQALLEALDRIVSVSSSHFRAAEVGQMSLFGAHTGVVEEIALPPAVIEISRREVLNWERELIGLYVSDHPLSPVMDVLTEIVTHFSGQLSEVIPNERVRVAGLITRIRHHQSKAGKPMAFVTIEDLQGAVDLVIFPRTWEKVAEVVDFDRIVLVDGRVDAEGAEPKILVDNITTEFSMTTPLSGPPHSAAPTPAPTRPVLESQTPEEPAPYEQDQADVFPEQPWADDMPPEPPSFTPDWETVTGVVAASPRPDPQPAESAPAPNGRPLAEVYAAPEPVSPPETEPAPGPLPEAEEPAFADAAPEIETPVIPEPALVEPAAERQAVADRPAILPSYLVPPAPLDETDGSVHMITVVLRSTGDKTRDVLRLRRIHGMITSYPGNDRFAFQLYERGRGYRLEFPNTTAGLTAELRTRLASLVGPENLWVEKITFL